MTGWRAPRRRSLNVGVGDVVFAAGRVHARGNPDNAVGFARLAATAHWAPGTLPAGEAPALRETVFWSPPELAAPNEADEINASLCYGFVFDICAVEVDRATAEVRIDKYITMHDCGRVLHPGMLAGQVTGGFAHALGAALYEEHVYAPDGGFLAGTLADYLIPTAMEVPEPLILHCETASPFTPLGAKGVGEGNCMSTPVCIANAVADALGLADVTLPLLPARLAPHVHGVEVVHGRDPAESGAQRSGAARASGADVAHPSGADALQAQAWGSARLPGGTPVRDSNVRGAGAAGARALSGAGSVRVDAPRDAVWRMLLDPDVLAGTIPGVHTVQRVSDTQFRAEVTLGVGPVQGRYRIEVSLSELDPPNAATLTGAADGALGFGQACGVVTLTDEGGATRVAWRYDAAIGGKIASVGGRLLDGAARVIIGRFFAALAARAGGERAPPGPLAWRRRLGDWLRALLRWRR